LYVFPSSSGIASMSISAPAVRFDLAQAVVDQRQRAQPEEVHLQEADTLDLLHRPLRDDFVLLRFVERDELGQRARRDHDPGGVDEAWRVIPSRRCATSSSSLTRFVLLLHLLQRGALLERLRKRHVKRRRHRLRDAIRVRVRDVHDARHARTTARAFIVPNVMIWATFALPYFCVTYLMTSPRRRSQKSMSMSGSDTRSGLRKRSKMRSYSIGSTSVIRRQ